MTEINLEKWLARFAEQSHEDRVMTIVEDGSCLDMLISMARECLALRAEVERLRILIEKLQPASGPATNAGNCNQRDGGGCDDFIRGTPTTGNCDGDGHYECKECFHFARTTEGGRDE